jgi:lipopolysaccharide heptosyltransferase I
MKILLIRLSAIGDVVRTLPALTCLRRAHPSAQIDWAVEDASRDIVLDQPDLDHTLVFPRRRLARVLLHPDEMGEARAALSGFLSALREARYDLVIDFQGTLKSALLARATRAPRLVGLGRGHAREMSHLLYNDPVTLPRGPMSRVDRALALVAHLGVPVDDATSDIPEKPADAAAVESFLATWPGAGTGSPVVLFPGTSRTQEYKRWPARHYAELAGMLRHDSGSPAVIAWGPGELHLAEEVVEQAPAGAAVLAPPLSLGQLTALIRRARVFVAGDTGPMHMAWTVGTPVVAVYGPTHPTVNRPGGRFSAVAYQKVFCSPCRNRGCIARTCLDRLSPRTVAETAVSVMRQAELAGAGRHAPSRTAERPEVHAPALRHDTIGGGSRPRPGGS